MTKNQSQYCIKTCETLVMYVNSSCANVCHYFFTAAGEEQDCVDGERVPSPEHENGENDESQQENADHKSDIEGITTDGKIRYTPR